MATSILPPVYKTLRASPEVVAIVADRIYFGGADENAAAPYIVWLVVGVAPENNLSQPPGIDQQAVQIDCYHATAGGVDALARAVRDKLETVTHMTGIVVSGRDDETGLFRISPQFDFWLQR